MEIMDVRSNVGFELLANTGRGQAATMVLDAGRSTGGPDNRHEGSDQWLYVILGEGKAVVEGEEWGLAEGSLLVIEAGEAHEITNDGESPLETFSIYTPPAY